MTGAHRCPTFISVMQHCRMSKLCRFRRHGDVGNLGDVPSPTEGTGWPCEGRQPVPQCVPSQSARDELSSVIRRRTKTRVAGLLLHRTFVCGSCSIQLAGWRTRLFNARRMPKVREESRTPKVPRIPCQSCPPGSRPHVSFATHSELSAARLRNALASIARNTSLTWSNSRSSAWHTSK